jgi:hypothetical protein
MSSVIDRRDSSVMEPPCATSCTVKTAAGEKVATGNVAATREALAAWALSLLTRWNELEYG